MLNRVIVMISVAILIGSVWSLHTYANSGNAKDLTVADFRYNVNKLTEAAAIIEWSKDFGQYTESGPYGSDKVEIPITDINADLKKALIKMGDKDKDQKLSDNEITALGLRTLQKEIYNKELHRMQAGEISFDANLKNYIVITKGEHAGKIIYNGKLRFIDSTNKQYFGIDLFRHR